MLRDRLTSTCGLCRFCYCTVHSPRTPPWMVGTDLDQLMQDPGGETG